MICSLIQLVIDCSGFFCCCLCSVSTSIELYHIICESEDSEIIDVEKTKPEEADGAVQVEEGNISAPQPPSPSARFSLSLSLPLFKEFFTLFFCPDTKESSSAEQVHVPPKGIVVELG